MRDKIMLVARPAGVYQGFLTNALVWLTCPKSATRFRHPCDNLASGPMGDWRLTTEPDHKRNGGAIMDDDTLQDSPSRENRPWNPNLDPELDHLYPARLLQWREVARRWLELNGPVKDRGPSKKNPAKGDLYFIQSAGGEIKIGVSSNFPARFSQLHGSSAVPLTLLHLEKDAVHMERVYHKQFKAHRRHGEWFNPAPEILAEIERLKAEA